MIIKTNNGRKLNIFEDDRHEVGGVTVLRVNAKGGVDESIFIPNGDIVGLFNYYMNVKAGTEKSDYITPANPADLTAIVKNFMGC